MNHDLVRAILDRRQRQRAWDTLCARVIRGVGFELIVTVQIPSDVGRTRLEGAGRRFAIAAGAGRSKDTKTAIVHVNRTSASSVGALRGMPCPWSSVAISRARASDTCGVTSRSSMSGAK